MATAVKPAASSAELQLVLDGIRKKRAELDQKFEADPMHYGITAEIAQLLEAENRLSERIEAAQRREQTASAKSKQKTIAAAYVKRCREIGELQERVERLVDELIDQSDLLRDAYKDVNGLAAQLDEIPVHPPAPLWQRNGGQALPYPHRVRAALQNL